jgi:hypothetical protein
MGGEAKTRSEELFEEFCERQRLTYQRLPTARNKSPDYRVECSGVAVVVEVKQLDESDEDRTHYESALAETAFAFFDATDGRVAEKLKSAADQLRPHSKSGHPTIVCICDMRRLAMLTPENIKVAMYGEEKVVIDRRHKDYDVVSPVHPGGNRQCTPKSNTSISAVGLLSYSVQELRLTIFHNRFARVPLPLACLAHVSTDHFGMDSASTPYEWRRMNASGARSLGALRD